MSRPDVLVSALELARRGAHVFPVDHPELDRCAGIGRHHDPETCTERGKHPCVAFTRDASTDPRQLAAWFTGYPRNVGVACGPSGLLVVDEDTDGALARYAASIGQTVPDTFTVATGRGRHFYFARGGLSLGNTEGALRGSGVNIRGEGGYVVGPGSLHATGTIYTVTNGAGADPAPDWLVDAVSGAARATNGVSSPTAADKPRGLAAVPDVIRGKRPDRPGERHEVLVRYASSLRARDVPTVEAEELFRAVWRRCEQPPVCETAMPWDEARDVLADVYGRYQANYARPDPAPDGLDPDDPDDPDAAVEAQLAAFARAVDRRAHDLRVTEAARVKVAAEKAGNPPPFDAGLLADILARPTEPPHRVDGLIPSEAGTEVVAQRKLGKTTFELNLARSLLTGEDFLGRFGVRRIDGCVGFLNYEVSAAQVARWADEVGVDRRRLFLVNLRGRRNPLGNDDDRAELAEQLRAHEVESVFVDPFGRAFIGKSQNDPGEVGAWLADLDRWARGDVGAVDVILSAHAGWDGERTRGASALEDWADSIITIVRDRDDDQLRFLKAEGRDVLVEEDRLDYDPSTRRLTLAGAGSRKHAARTRHLDELVPLVVGAVTAEPGLTGYKLQKVLREAGASYQRGDEVKAAKLAVERGQLVVEDGPRNSKRYSPAPTYPDLSRPIPVGQVTTYPDLPSIEREVVTGRSDGPPIPADQAHLDSDDDLCPGCVQPTADPAPSTCPCPDLHTEPGRLS